MFWSQLDSCRDRTRTIRDTGSEHRLVLIQEEEENQESVQTIYSCYIINNNQTGSGSVFCVNFDLPV